MTEDGELQLSVAFHHGVVALCRLPTLVSDTIFVMFAVIHTITTGNTSEMEVTVADFIVPPEHSIVGWTQLASCM